MSDSPSGKVNRWHIKHPDEAAAFLSKKGRNAAKASGGKRIWVIGGADNQTDAVCRDLEAHNIRICRGDLNTIAASEPMLPDDLGGIVCTYADIRRSHAAAELVLSTPGLERLPFECVVLPETDYKSLQDHDRYGVADFISPLPNYSVDIFSIYEEALNHFTPKCDLRDFMDVCQLLDSLERNRVPGAIAEFGSFEGHSGYLMADFLNRTHAKRRLLLFDTFERFPSEPFGIDQFWSDSHPVDFQTLKRKFEVFPFVELIKGDFTETFDQTGIQQLAMAYVDCDSFRATEFLLNRIFNDVLAPGGILAVEDYGHPQLLGSRVAVHRYFDGRPGCVPFFSQFSGLYIVVKL